MYERWTMTPMTPAEIALMDEDEAEMNSMGLYAMDTTIGELAQIGAGTTCGTVGNTCFVGIASYSNGKYSKRKVKCWIDTSLTPPEVSGMVHIKIQTETTAEKIDDLATNFGGSLRYNDGSPFPGFIDFEVE
jgi:hypothetical protein